ncbi:phosphotransferase [Thermomonospora cellulosilytica]|uniref:Aminoglycoside phosphotransferase (APT) family kinase protein n=1 Tax=Thermomonospora cellulosilytica TaxID=1411118 RepID=A0A7W3R7N6_9ACTN|nr:phosphotransferase [Thermomonospora cellulosilytica]MBA9002821.1 aminoglycoside phosphotransferase (APT) family kinase protein [Thermomonospora cellulosilytica]
MPPALPEDVHAVLAEVADRCRVPTGDARVLRRHSNTVIALPTARLLVRVAGNPAAFDGVTTSIQVTRWLASRGYPCVAPAKTAGPFRVNGRVVSVWQLADTTDDHTAGTGGELGRLLRLLHDQPAPPFPLPRLTDPLTGVAAAAEQHPDALTTRDRDWLTDRITQLRQRWTTLHYELPTGLIHGDAHSNNLLPLHGGGVLLGDWDHVAFGPREWDLIQIHYMQRRFGRHTAREIEEFTAAYGWDVRAWPGFETLLAVREISGLSPYIRRAPTDQTAREEVAYRLDTIRRGDGNARWNSPSGK